MSVRTQMCERIHFFEQHSSPIYGHLLLINNCLDGLTLELSISVKLISEIIIFVDNRACCPTCTRVPSTGRNTCVFIKLVSKKMYLINVKAPTISCVSFHYECFISNTEKYWQIQLIARSRYRFFIDRRFPA